MKDLALMVKKLERKQRDSYQFKNTGIAKQAEFLQQAGDWLEDSLKTKLEKEMGRVPTGLQEVITAGGAHLHQLQSQGWQRSWIRKERKMKIMGWGSLVGIILEGLPRGGQKDR